MSFNWFFLLSFVFAGLVPHPNSLQVKSGSCVGTNLIALPSECPYSFGTLTQPHISSLLYSILHSCTLTQPNQPSNPIRDYTEWVVSHTILDTGREGNGTIRYWVLLIWWYDMNMLSKTHEHRFHQEYPAQRPVLPLRYAWWLGISWLQW